MSHDSGLFVSDGLLFDEAGADTCFDRCREVLDVEACESAAGIAAKWTRGAACDDGCGCLGVEFAAAGVTTGALGVGLVGGHLGRVHLNQEPVRGLAGGCFCASVCRSD